MTRLNQRVKGAAMDKDLVRQPIRVLHVITGLKSGGAEMMLYKLLSGMDRRRFACTVVSLTDDGDLADRIQALGVPVYSLNMKGAMSMPLAILRLRRMMKDQGTQMVQCWMYHADLLGGLAGWLMNVPVIWGIRQSNFDVTTSKQATIRIMHWCARLSQKIPTRIVCCSDTACRIHTQQGYATHKMVMIPNGFQVEIFRPDAQVRDRTRAALKIPANAAVVGIVGRFDPQKDHKNFVKASARVMQRLPHVYFLLCGKGLSADNTELMAWIREEGVADHCLLLGQRDDLNQLYCAMDVLVSASAYGEGFPNVVGEAMACAVPCVVTDVGDSALIVGDSGRVVPPRDVEALAAAIQELLLLSLEERNQLGMAARRRIEENYALPMVVERYQDLYEGVVAQISG